MTKLTIFAAIWDVDPVNKMLSYLNLWAHIVLRDFWILFE